MSRQEFDATLEAFGRGGMGVVIPFDVPTVFGSRGQVKVTATIDGVPYRGSIAPMGGGHHTLGIVRKIRERLGKGEGDIVHITLERDTEPRVVVVPDDLKEALKATANAWETFEAFAYTHRKEYVRWVESAKKAATRARRIGQAVERIAEGRKLS